MEKINTIRNFLREAKIEEALLVFDSVVENGKAKNRIDTIHGWYSQVKKEYHSGLETNEGYITLSNRIRQGLLEFLSEIEEESKRVENSLDNTKIDKNNSLSDAVSNSKAIKSIVKEIRNQSETIQTIRAMEDIKTILKSYIPEFKELTSDLHEKVFNDVRDENIFKIEPRRVFLFGRTNAGKTTTINNLLNEDIFPASIKMSLTKSLASVEHAGGLIFYDSPGIGDEREPENTTRVSLNIPPIRGSIDKIRLIDVTKDGKEGPQSYSITPKEVLNNEITENYNSELKFIGKEFGSAEFGLWSKDKFDFYVFVLSIGSGHALDMNQVDFLQDFYSHKPKDVVVFKVFNIWNDGKNSRYSKHIKDLDEDVKTAINQAIERLQNQNIPNADEWYLVESNFGTGFDSLIKGFAKSLPADVLMRIERTVKSSFQSIIQDRLDEFFLNYVARVASIVGANPVDMSIGKENLLSYSIKSIFIISDYIYQKKSVLSPEIINDMIDKIRSEKFVIKKKKKKKLKSKSVDVMVQKYIGTGNAYWDRVYWEQYRIPNVVNSPEKETQYYYDTKKKTKTYYRIGGIDAINFAVTLGISLKNIYRDSKNISAEELKKMITQNLANVSKKTSSIYISEELRKFEQRNNRMKAATEIYSSIRKVME